jgi:hypothetical protein
MSVLANGTKFSECNALTIMTLRKQVSKSEPGTTRGSHQGVQRRQPTDPLAFLYSKEKPAFMLTHEFMQCWTQLFSYLDIGYFLQTMELPTAQEKSKQIFFVQLKAHLYKFRDEHDCLPPSLCHK